MEIDFECAWADLKGFVLEKRSHGQADLLREIARLELEHRAASGRASLPPQHPVPSTDHRPLRAAVGS